MSLGYSPMICACGSEYQRANRAGRIAEACADCTKIRYREYKRAWAAARLRGGKCVKCGQPRASSTTLCDICTDRNKAGCREYYVANKETILERGRPAALAWRKANSAVVANRIREWHTANPERVRAFKNRWKKANPQSVRLSALQRRLNRLAVGGVISVAEWREVLETFGNACAYCLQVKPCVCIDHVIPISKGGTNTVDNIVPACVSCNSSKGARGLLSWALSKRRVSPAGILRAAGLAA